MDFRIIGEFDGTPAKYEDFSAKLLEPVCREFLKDDVLVVIYIFLKELSMIRNLAKLSRILFRQIQKKTRTKYSL